MSFLTREDFYLQRVLLELEIKEVLVKLFERCYISNYNEITLSEVLLNLRDLHLVEKMVESNGVLKLNRELLEENSNEEFSNLYLKYLEIEDKIKKYDNLFLKTFKDPYKKRIMGIESLNIDVKTEITALYCTSYSICNVKGFEKVLSLGLIGSYVGLKDLKKFDGCPLWENSGMFLVPVRSVKNKMEYKKLTNKSVCVVEVDGFGLIGIQNSIKVNNQKGLAKGVLDEALPVDKIWEVCKQ